MQRGQYAEFHEWFSNHVCGYYLSNPEYKSWIQLKVDHTGRVCDIITRIGRLLELPEEDLLLAGAIALFHDVGRFSQVQLYGTYNDHRSENHAALGAKVLAESGVLECLAVEEEDLIIKAVELHNLRELPKGLPERLFLFARLIQDADKLDILEIYTRYYLGENPEYGVVLDSYLPDTPEYSIAVIEGVRRKQVVNYQDVKTRNDRKVVNLAWIFGLHFKYSLQEIQRNGYVEKIIGVLPKTDNTQEIYKIVRCYLEEGLNNMES